MSRKFPRLMLVAFVAVGFSVAPMLSASASPTVDVYNPENGGFNTGTTDHHTDISKGDSVRWYIKEGTHTITPDNDHVDGQKWPTGVKPSGDLNANDTFDADLSKAAGGRYFYFCEKHPEMTGYINVKDQTPTTTTTVAPTTTTTVPPTTTTTAAHVTAPPATTPTTSAPAASQGAKPPVAGAPAPAATTTTKPEKEKKDKKDETTTTTAPPPPVAPDLPDSAIIPALPGSETGTLTQNGAETPGESPTGDAIALLKNKNKGGEAKKLLIISGIGLGALGFGTAGYKYANRSSKYFPA